MMTKSNSGVMCSPEDSKTGGSQPATMCTCTMTHHEPVAALSHLDLIYGRPAVRSSCQLLSTTYHSGGEFVFIPVADARLLDPPPKFFFI